MTEYGFRATWCLPRNRQQADAFRFAIVGYRKRPCYKLPAQPNRFTGALPDLDTTDKLRFRQRVSESLRGRPNRVLAKNQDSSSVLMLSYIRSLLQATGMVKPDAPRRILVAVETSGQMLSISSDPTFSITLNVKVDGPDTVTVNAFRTILLTRHAVLDYQGLTFKNTETGELADRNVIDINYRVPDHLKINSTFVIEIPSRNSSSPYAVTHTLHVPEVTRPQPGELPLSMEEEVLL